MHGPNANEVAATLATLSNQPAPVRRSERKRQQIMPDETPETRGAEDEERPRSKRQRRTPSDSLGAANAPADKSKASSSDAYDESSLYERVRNDGLTLLEAPGTTTGFKSVHHTPGRGKPYRASLWDSKHVTKHLGRFVTALEAAICVAKYLRDPNEAAEWITERAESRKTDLQSRGPGGGKRGSSDGGGSGAGRRRVDRQADGSVLWLDRSGHRTSTGYKGVSRCPNDCSTFTVQVWYRGKFIEHKGGFASALDGALHYATVVARLEAKGGK